MSVKKLALFCWLVVFSVEGWCAFTGADFVEKCHDVNLAKGAETPQQAINRALDMGSCGGFVGGVVQGVNLVGELLQAQRAAPHNFICAPSELHPMDIVREVSGYISQHAEMKNLPAQAAVYSAMVTKYPCKK